MKASNLLILLAALTVNASISYGQPTSPGEYSVTFDSLLNSCFIRNEGWNGGDGAYSLPLPDGRILWSFGDSFYGTVDPGRNRNGNKNVMVRNSFLVQEHKSSCRFESLNPGFLKDTQTHISYKKEKEQEHWYWPLDATVYQDQVQMALMHMTKTGNGMWDFAPISVDIAVLSLPDLKVADIMHNKYTGETAYGSAIWEADDGYTYIYGSSRKGLETLLHVARVPGGDLTADWQFWNGTGWQDSPSDFSIHGYVSSMFSIWKEDGIFYLLTQEIFLGRKIFLFQSHNPTGPFSGKRLLWEVPAEHGSGDMFSYNAIIHPELSAGNELVVSYSKNPHNFWDNFTKPGSADKYLPVFIRIVNWKSETQ